MSRRLPVAAQRLDDPSRREFLGRVGGAGVLLAAGGASLLGGAPRAARAGVIPSAGPLNHLIELEGKFAGVAHAIEGGVLDVQVATLRPQESTSGWPTKHIANIGCAPLAVRFGAGMTQGWYEWIRASAIPNSRPINGAITTFDAAFQPMQRINFTQAFLTELSLPSLDSSVPTTGLMTAKLACDSCLPESPAPSGTISAPAPASGKPWWQGRFRLSIMGVETSTQAAVSVNPPVFSCAVVTEEIGLSRAPTKHAARAEVSNLEFLVPLSAAGPLFAWYDTFVLRGQNQQKDERQGVLEFFSDDRKTLLAALAYQNIGIQRLELVSAQASSPASLAKVSCYVESMSFSLNKLSF